MPVGGSLQVVGAEGRAVPRGARSSSMELASILRFPIARCTIRSATYIASQTVIQLAVPPALVLGGGSSGDTGTVLLGTTLKNEIVRRNTTANGCMSRAKFATRRWSKASGQLRQGQWRWVLASPIEMPPITRQDWLVLVHMCSWSWKLGVWTMLPMSASKTIQGPVRNAKR